MTFLAGGLVSWSWITRSESVLGLHSGSTGRGQLDGSGVSRGNRKRLWDYVIEVIIAGSDGSTRVGLEGSIDRTEEAEVATVRVVCALGRFFGHVEGIGSESKCFEEA